MEREVLSVYGLGNTGTGLKRGTWTSRILLTPSLPDVSFLEGDEFFGHAPGSHPPSAPIRSTTRAQVLPIAHTDHIKAEIEYKKENDNHFATSRKLVQQGMNAYNLGNLGAGLKARKLDGSVTAIAPLPQRRSRTQQ